MNVSPLEYRRRPQRTHKVAETVAREILRDVTRFRNPGDMLESETAMLERYDVSRASLREALRILEVHGLITVKPGRNGGPVVQRVDAGDYGRTSTLYFHALGASYGHIVESRLALEPLMARLAAERGDRRKIELLRGTVDRPIDLADDEDYLDHSIGFHDLIAEMSGNPILDLMASSLKDIYLQRVTDLLFPAQDRTEVVAAHTGILAAVERGNGAEAERLMAAHMEDFARYASEVVPGLLDDVVEWS